MIDIKRDNLSITQPMLDFENEICQKLTEAQAEARSNSKHLSHDEVFDLHRRKIASYRGSSENAR